MVTYRYRAKIGYKGGGRGTNEGRLEVDKAISLKEVQEKAEAKVEEYCRKIGENGMDENAWIIGDVEVAPLTPVVWYGGAGF